MKPLLNISGLSHRFLGPPLFTGLELTLEPGACIGIHGPNGCGKSTLLHLLTGLIPLQKGIVNHQSKDLKPLLLSQQQGLFRELSAEEHFLVHGLDWAAAYQNQGLEPDLSSRHKHPHQLSHLQRSQLSLSRHLSLEPQVMLLDEPWAGLSREQIEQQQQQLKEWQEQSGGALLIVDHNRQALVDFCTENYLLGPKGLEVLSAGGELLAPFQDLSEKQNNRSPLLEVQLNSLTIDGRALVEQPFSIRVAEGEGVVLVGPPACGKSLLLKLISGLEKANYRGSIRWKDQLLDVLSAEARGRLGIAWLSQQRLGFPGVSISQYLKLQGPRQEVVCQWSRRLLPSLDLTLDRLIDRLSGGEFRILSLASAFAQQPSLLLLDAPFEGLAPHIKLSTAEHLDAIAEQGMSWLASATEQNQVTHRSRLQSWPVATPQL